MNQLNVVFVEGNLVRDPTFSTTPNGAQVCTLCIATNRFFKQNGELKKEVSFFDIEVWGKESESCLVLKKGHRVRIRGRLKQDRWTDAEGNKLVRVKILNEHIEFFPEKENDGNMSESSIPFPQDYDL